MPQENLHQEVDDVTPPWSRLSVLQHTTTPQKPSKAPRKKAGLDVREQPGLKLPIKGRKPTVEEKVEQPLKPARTRAWVYAAGGYSISAEPD